MASALQRLAEPHSAVEFRVTARCVNSRDEDESMEYTVSYFAPDSNLVAAGIATTEMLGRGKCGRSRRDAAGNLFQLQRRKTFSEIRFRKLTAARAMTLSGVTSGQLEAARAEYRQWRSEYASEYQGPPHEPANLEEAPGFARGLAWGIVQRGIEEGIPVGDEAQQFRFIREVLALAGTKRSASDILSGALSLNCSLKQTVMLLRQAPDRDAPKVRLLTLVVNNDRPQGGCPIG